ncbi:3-deoxy-manno-octulosonate cytidylyltransferase [Silvanigrella aquatica]|uniref:3-deoxy-D-manno-octulosonate cytidylyltransferase n=1 Tax=Silvanigrella aquatica TaxID=1915309 RepID=A0A1L4D2P5_9BACT|nr:3-deoxy-manno-octulosonate cytidylyltransferase [Silvanigrella aquatica]APJ04473.1 3-deoxy-D-manno-octulosonate cytidylyltransferase [Silvanigrella aquatica]
MNVTAPQQNNKSIIIIIPARFASTRLPGKPLLKIGSKSIISHVATRAKTLAERLSTLNNVNSVNLIVATDHQDIFQEVTNIGVNATMTSSHLINGTERVYAAAISLKEKIQISDHDLVINIQGDEPFFSIDDVENLAKKMLENTLVPLGTLAYKRNDVDLFFSSSVVKVVRDNSLFALYFSRAPIPFPKELLGATGHDWVQKISLIKENISFLHHVGVYAFQFEALCQFAGHLKHSRLEELESLEQLRALQSGWKILVNDATSEPFGIDTPEDLEKANVYLKNNL